MKKLTKSLNFPGNSLLERFLWILSTPRLSRLLLVGCTSASNQAWNWNHRNIAKGRNWWHSGGRRTRESFRWIHKRNWRFVWSRFELHQREGRRGWRSASKARKIEEKKVKNKRSSDNFHAEQWTGDASRSNWWSRSRLALRLE